MSERASTQAEKESTESANCWRHIGASVRGLSHERLGLPCQDAHYVEKPGDNILVAAVADGAGSASLSEIGATLAVQTAVRELCSFVKEANIGDDPTSLEAAILDAMVAAKLVVEAEAELRNITARELASTLLLTIAMPSFVVAAQIGDGGIVVKDKNGSITGLTLPEISEYINEAYFLVMPDSLSHAQLQTWRGDTAQIAMFSDGLQLLCLKMPEAEPFTGFFMPIFEFADKTIDVEQGQIILSDFLTSKRVRDNTDDDVTLVLATLSESPLCQSPSDSDQPAESSPLTNH